MAYTPPNGNQAGFSFSGTSWSPPTGDQAGFNIGQNDDAASYVYPGMGDLLVFGSINSRNQHEFLYPSGFDNFIVGGSYTLFDPYPSVPGHYAGFFFDNTAYTTPDGNQIGFSFGEVPGTIFPVSWNGIGFGVTFVENFNRAIEDATVGDQSAFGDHDVTAGAGADYILPGGIAPPPQTGPQADRQLPTPVIDFRVRYALPTGIAAGSAGTPDVSLYYRYVDLAGRGPSVTTYGTPVIDFGIRYITVPFIFSTAWGSAVVGRTLNIDPSGWDSSVFGNIDEILVNQRRIFVTDNGADHAGYGNPVVRNAQEHLYPFQWLSDEFNFPVVYNLDRYLLVQPYMGSNVPQEAFGQFTEIANVNRTMRTFGHISSYVGLNTWIYNNAVPIVPAGLDATLWGTETFIAYENREVVPSGWNSELYNPIDTIVYNDARIIAPSGIAPTSAVGQPVSVVNANRTVSQYFPYGVETFGTAFIADAIRYLGPYAFLDAPNGIPEVRLNPYPIAPAGIGMPQFGGHTVYEHFTIVTPFSTNVHSTPWVGEPFVQNRNKTLAVYPSDQSLYGHPRIENLIQYLTVTIGNTQSFGSAYISYRTKILTPAPMSVPVFTTHHQIRNEIPDPPAQQRIEVDGFDGLQIPSPVFNIRTIFVVGIYEGAYGQPKVSRNQIEPVPGFFSSDEGFGTPTLIYTRFLYPQSYPSLDGTGESDLFSSKPRLTPHTIYAPNGDQATAQARDNHPSPTPYEIDGRHPTTAFSGSFPWFGHTTVTNYYRTIGPVPAHGALGSSLDPSSHVGQPSLTLKLQYIYPTPIRSLRFGAIVFLDVPQYLNFDVDHNGLENHTEFGSATVAPPYEAPLPYANPSGFNSAVFGTTRIELFNREITPAGIPHRGNPQQGLTNPWGLPLVGYPRVYNWSAGVLTLWGVPRVEYKIRTIYPTGTQMDSFQDEDLGSFADRMRVRRRNPADSILGMFTEVFGFAVISQYIKDLGAYGHKDSHVGTPKVSMNIQCIGWDSAEYGDIDEWEAGKIKPYGDDLSLFGTPRMGRGISVVGFEGAMGSARLAWSIYVYGMPPVGFDGPSVTDQFGCSSRVVTPLPVLSALLFGEEGLRVFEPLGGTIYTPSWVVEPVSNFHQIHNEDGGIGDPPPEDS